MLAEKKWTNSRVAGDLRLKNVSYLYLFQAHYGSGTASHFLGFGMENVVSVDCDEKSHMCMIDLENKIKQTIEEVIIGEQKATVTQLQNQATMSISL